MLEVQRAIISEPPVFDFDRAKKIKEQVDQEGIDEFPALKLAWILSLYNIHDEARERVLYRINRLIKEEIGVSDSDNPLPTIGVEVESPRKPFADDQIGNSLRYAEFFDTIGMPRNKVNERVDHSKLSIASQPAWDNTFWEFSPHPSYSTSVQNRILCELIHGRFIPSLKFSQNPHYIRNYLDDKLVSLHVNLGIPAWLVDKSLYQTPDLKLFASLFVLGFTSPRRLFYRQTTNLVNDKSGEATKKSALSTPKRIEIKALEVRTSSTYRLLEEVQLVGASVFVHLDRANSPLGQIWFDTKSELSTIYDNFGIQSDIVSDKKKSAKFVSRTDISNRLRELITRKASRIRGLLSLL